jgi:hypothetical protein
MANRSILSAEALQRSIAKFWPSTNPLSLKLGQMLGDVVRLMSASPPKADIA